MSVCVRNVSFVGQAATLRQTYSTNLETQVLGVFYKMDFSEIDRSRLIQRLYKTGGEELLYINSLRLVVNKNVLTPHPDTLRLVKIAKRVIEENPGVKTVADVGTGSGLISICLAKQFPKKSFYASDISKKALKVAINNAFINKTANICFLQNLSGSWMSEYKDVRLDFVISNPPFVGNDEYTNRFLEKYPEVKYQPDLAIRSCDNKGYKPYLEILKNSDLSITKLFLFQCNSQNMSGLLKEISTKFSWLVVEKIKGDDGNLRYLMLKSRY